MNLNPIQEYASYKKNKKKILIQFNIKHAQL